MAEELNIIQYIANYGMPAILCVVLLLLLSNEQKKREEDNRQTRDTISQLKDVIRDNNNLLQRILDQWK